MGVLRQRAVIALLWSCPLGMVCPLGCVWGTTIGIPPTWGLLNIPKASAGCFDALGEGSCSQVSLFSGDKRKRPLSCAGGGLSWRLGKNFRGRVEKHGNRMSRAVVQSPPLEVFRKAVGLWVSAERGGAGLMVGLDDLKGLFQPQGFCDSNFQRSQIAFSSHSCAGGAGLGTSRTGH